MAVEDGSMVTEAFHGPQSSVPIGTETETAPLDAQAGASTVKCCLASLISTSAINDSWSGTVISEIPHISACG